MAWLDDYERRARLVPGLMTLFPLLVLTISLGVRDRPVVAGAIAFLTAAGGPVLLSQIVRHRGLTFQRQIWAARGGSPTIQSLRHVSPIGTEARRNHWRSEVARSTGQALPTADEESQDPAGSDARYDVATARLIELTRNQSDFPLVYSENKSYGFERNLRAMQGPALLVVALALTTLLTFLVLSHIGIASNQVGDLYIGATLLILWTVGWAMVPSDSRVQLAGERYAVRLLDSATRVGV